MSLIGSKIEPFQLRGFHENQFVDISDQDLEGSWSVLFFYPADFTFVCPTELGDLADNYLDFETAGTEIYAISTDTHETHLAWHGSSEMVGRVQFPMLSDPTGVVCRAFDVMIEDLGRADRATIVIDPDGIVQVVEMSADGIGRSAAELLRKLKAAQHVRDNPDQVCPANWVLGDETLVPSADLVGRL